MTRRVMVSCAAALAIVCLVTPATSQAQPQAGPISNLQGSVQALEEKAAALDAALDALRTEMRDADDDLQAQIAALDGQLAAVQTRLDALDAAVNAPDGPIASLQTRLGALEQEVADLSEIAANFSLATLQGSACITPAGQAGSIAITQSKSGVAVLRCRAGEGRFIDNLDGTITDTVTGLMWEKKTTPFGSGQNSDDLHDVDNRYTWNAGMGDWLDRLNGRKVGDANEGGFAGYSDWRVPTLAELRTILDTGFVPFVDPVFGPTSNFIYWTASTDAGNSSDAWFVSFAVDGFIDSVGKDVSSPVRAVRGGL